MVEYERKITKDDKVIQIFLKGIEENNFVVTPKYDCLGIFKHYNPWVDTYQFDLYDIIKVYNFCKTSNYNMENE